MKLKGKRYQKFLDWLEVIRARGERSELVLKLDDILTGYDAKSLVIRSFIIAILIHLFIIFPPLVESEKYDGVKTQMIEIQFGTVPEADESGEEEEEVATLEQAEDVVAEEEEIEESEEPQEKSAEKSEPKKQLKKESRKGKKSGSQFGNQDVGAIAPEDYLELLQYTVQEMSSVPAEGAELKGVAVLRLTFDRRGYVQNYTLQKATGSAILDSAALSVAQRLTREPFPAAPDGFDRGERLMKYDFLIKYPPD